MPFLLPRKVNETERAALVLAFGKLSLLEISTLASGALEGLECPSERVCAFQMQPSTPKMVQRLAGIHKFAPLIGALSGKEGEMEAVAARSAELSDEVANLSVSAYGVAAEDYEEIVRDLLDAFRSLGFKKIRLLRPEGNELPADDVVSRGALDYVVFPSRKGLEIGLTSYVPDSVPVRERGTMKPLPRSEISLSPRLAKLLVNLAGLPEGRTLLDPFCGAGTILAEALMQRVNVVGVDNRRKLVAESRQNLEWVRQRGGKGAFFLAAGDARDLPKVLGRKKVDGVVTEPILLPPIKFRPNMDLAKELVDEAGSVYADALASISDVLRPGGRAVVVVPVLQTTDGNEVFVGLDGRQLGLKQFQPGPVTFQYPVRPSFESTRWVKRGVYVFEAAS